MRVPRATYRLQLNGDFGFAEAAALVPYLDELGISDLYASPYLKARPGSAHGYDVVDHGQLNPELGTGGDYRRLISALGERGMGHLLDIVPNHVGTGPENAAWMDVLENGPASRWAPHFDIDWRPEDRPGLRGRVLLPVLGDHYRALLERGELGLTFDAGSGTLCVSYHEHRFPVDPRTYPLVLGGVRAPGEARTAFESLIAGFGDLPAREDGEGAERERWAGGLKVELAALVSGSPGVAEAVEERLRRFAGEPGSLHGLLEAQAYRLALWRVAGEEINYRRFFAVNDLAGIRVERPEVFESVHALVLRLVGNGAVTGLRIDHPDGLRDPAGYLQRLQAAVAGVSGERAYVLVEKILGEGERLPEEWPVAGTTGYEFLNALNGLFVDGASAGALEEAYGEFLGECPDFEEILLRSKRRMMRAGLASELDGLARRLRRICARGRRFDFALGALRAALAALVAHFPVYRTYIVPGQVSDDDRRHIDDAVARAREEGLVAEPGALDLIRDVLVGAEGLAGEEEAEFTARFQQYTGPVMAKGMEDTALYVYNRLVSLNEVGGEPLRFGVPVAEFHEENAERARSHPHSMLTTSTHDTKRGEDVRARIDVLSEIPVEWREKAALWREMNRPFVSETRGGTAPSPNDEYLLYQTLLGAWPLGDPDEGEVDALRVRLEDYMEKAMREAGERTSHEDPDEDYERGVGEFVAGLFSEEGAGFRDDFLTFWRRVARAGAINSLSGTLIKLTAPGVPDVYWGNELWDFSLVDPDNRRPMDFDLRRRLLSNLREMPPSGAGDLIEADAWWDGRPKLHVVRAALALRRERPALFAEGGYRGLETSGEGGERIVAFAREHAGDAAVVVVPRLCAGTLGRIGGPLLVPPDSWGETAVVLPEGLAATPYRNVLTGERVGGGEAAPPVAELLGGFPVALLAAERA